MERLEALEKAVSDIAGYIKALAEDLEAISKEVRELKQEATKQGKRAKPASLKLHKTAFKVKESRYNNGSKIVIVEKGKDSIAFALNKEDWLKLREFLDSYFGIADNGNSSNGSKPKSYQKKSYSKKNNSKPAVKVVKGYSNALEEAD